MEYTSTQTFPEKPSIQGPLSQAWDYLVNRNGVCKTSEFDADFQPIGPALRKQLFAIGVSESESRGKRIMFF